MSKMVSIFLSTLIYVGMIDNLEGNYAAVEMSNQQGEITRLEIPILLFPCEVSEGDYFYTFEIDGVREIRCGEPPTD